LTPFIVLISFDVLALLVCSRWSLAGLSLVSRWSLAVLALLSLFSRSSLSLFSLSLFSLAVFSLALLQVAPGRAHAFGGVAGRKPHGTHVLFVFSGGPRQLCGRGRHVFGIFADGAKRERCDGRRGSGQHGWHTSVAKKIAVLPPDTVIERRKKKEKTGHLKNQKDARSFRSSGPKM
jgi:hypothetical protein